jgi:hypothetical protein
MWHEAQACAGDVQYSTLQLSEGEGLYCIPLGWIMVSPAGGVLVSSAEHRGLQGYQGCCTAAFVHQLRDSI